MACLGVRPCSTGGITVQSRQVSDRVKLPGRVTFRGNPIIKCTTIEIGKKKTNINTRPEKFDRWMKDSVGEIVKNLREAPLFVHVYGGDEHEPNTKLKTEKAVEEEWDELKGNWVKGEEESPQGIILVEELKEGEIGIYDENEGQDGKYTKAWGVLIQGKGEKEEENGIACYLLKTSRVGCANLGLFSTHYCLVKVKNFRESARSQLTKCWLA